MRNKTNYSKKRPKKKSPYPTKRSLGTWIYLCILFAALVFAGYSVYRWVRIQTTHVPDKKVSADRVVTGRLKTKGMQSERADDRGITTGTENRMAIVIDDMGRDPLILDEILEIDAPITVSVLPHLSHSLLVAEKANAAGREVILHLPMEPHEYPEKRPGSGALFVHMNRGEIIEQVKGDIMNVPYISGVNNHMGSKFMEDEQKVEIVLDQLKKRDLFFLDSLTSKNSKGIRIAKKIGLRHVARDIFLDNDCDFEETLDILHRIAEKRNSWKTLVIIGHPHESTIQALKHALPMFHDRKIRIVPLSDLVR